MNYFYDKQIRRYLQQVIRVFSNFHTQIGVDELGKPLYQKIPVRYGDLSRQVSHIMKENSENKISTIPMMSVYINQLRLSPDRRIKPSDEIMFRLMRNIIIKILASTKTNLEIIIV